MAKQPQSSNWVSLSLLKVASHLVFHLLEATVSACECACEAEGNVQLTGSYYFTGICEEVITLLKCDKRTNIHTHCKDTM